MTYKTYILLLVGGLLLAACQESEEVEEVPGQVYSLDMTVCLQPDVASEAGTRAVGDPGTYEHFNFPRYLYVYAVGFTDAEVEAAGTGELPLGGGKVYPLKVDDEDVNRVTISDNRSDWTGYAMPIDPPQTLNDSVFGSTVNISIKVESEVKLMRFYVAASKVALKSNGHELGIKVGDDDQVFKTNKTESDVLGLTFDVDDDLKPYLHDIYSSPYNYKPTATYGGKYYYTVDDLKNNHDIRRLIYHVAAKVDVKWNVAEEQQGNYRITYVEAQKLKQKNCYLFRQMENTWDATDDAAETASPYSVTLMSGDIGQQWYGRQYFYTIPFKRDNSSSGGGAKDFDVNLLIRKSGFGTYAGQTQNYQHLYHDNLSSSDYDVFTPWVRLDMSFSSDLE